jgi:microcystin-dependent protein
MPTTNRNYQTPATGTEVDTWGDVLNANAELIDNNLGAVASVALSNANVTLTGNQYKCGTIALSGTLTGNCIVFFPNVQGWWKVRNLCTGNFYAAVRLAAGGNQIGIPPGEIVDVVADGTNMSYANLAPRVGDYVDYAGATVPLWASACTIPPFLLCDGSTFSAGTYPVLNSILGGTTLPDARGRARFALNGGTSRITAAGSGIDGDTRFAAGGAQTVTLQTSELPAHNHGVNDPGHTHTVPLGTANGGSPNALQAVNSAGTATSGSSTTGITIQNTGGGGAHNNMPPALIGGITMIRAA